MYFALGNPALFRCRDTIHGMWPSSQGPRNDTYYVGDNPQYTLIVNDPVAANVMSGKATSQSAIGTKSVWILLSRHVMLKDQDNSDNDADFLTVHVYKGTGNRIYGAPSISFVKGAYSSDPNYLARFDIETDPLKEWHAFTLVLSQLDKKRDISYSLSVFSTVGFRLTETPPAPANKLVLGGAWSSDAGTNGGTQSSVNFYRNPQFRLDVLALPGPSKKTDFHIHAMYPKDVSASICLVRSATVKEPRAVTAPPPAERIDYVATEDEVLSSGDYRPGFCAVDGALPPGSYTIVLSAFMTSMVGPYGLTVSSAFPNFSFIELSQEGYGLVKTVMTGAWSVSDGTSVGCNNFGKYEMNPTYLFKCNQPISVSGRLVMLSSDTPSNPYDTSL